MVLTVGEWAQIGRTHAKYNKAIRELLDNYRESVKPSGNLTREEVATFLKWIKPERVLTRGLPEANKGAFQSVSKWLKGLPRK